MLKAKVVKEIIGEPLKKEGFEYAGYGKLRDRAWQFKREREGLTQWIFICQQLYRKALYVEIGVVRQGKDEIERFYGIENFNENIRGFDKESSYFDDETFKKALGRLLDQIYEYFLPGLEVI